MKLEKSQQNDYLFKDNDNFGIGFIEGLLVNFYRDENHNLIRKYIYNEDILYYDIGENNDLYFL